MLLGWSSDRVVFPERITARLWESHYSEVLVSHSNCSVKRDHGQESPVRLPLEIVREISTEEAAFDLHLLCELGLRNCIQLSRRFRSTIWYSDFVLSRQPREILHWRLRWAPSQQTTRERRFMILYTSATETSTRQGFTSRTRVSEAIYPRRSRREDDRNG